MKKFFVVLFILSTTLSACSPANPTAITESVLASTATQIPPTVTATATKIPPTPTVTPTPTVSLPVSQLTPVPSSSTKITDENVHELQEIARYYGEISYIAKVTKDREFLFILDPDGLTKYNYNSLEALVNIPLVDTRAFTRDTAGLQISDDGSWVLINNKWLLDLRNDKEPKLNALSEKIDLQNNFSRIFYLSPNGSMIAVAQSRCPNTCEHFFRIVNTENFQVLYTTSGLTSRRLAAFSPDGMYFAVADLLSVETSGGGINVAGGTVGIWTTSDFSKVSSMKVNFPFYITDIVFSDNSTLLAIAQTSSIEVIDVLSGEIKVSANNLCESYDRSVVFVPSSISKILEKSDCSSGVWTISESTVTLTTRDVPDFSKIILDEEGKFQTISYPQPTISDFKAFRSQSYFNFQNNDGISFKNLDVQTLDNHSCDLSLADGSINCQSHNGREDRILATDGRYYSYRVVGNKVNIYSPDNRSLIFYSMPFYNYSFELLALDTVNSIVFYVNYLNPNESSIVIQDMESNNIIAKWDGRTSVLSVSFSENRKLAALCRTIMPRGGKLAVFDLTEKKIVFDQDFQCGNPSISNDGSKIVVRESTGLATFSGEPPYERKHIEMGQVGGAQAFSPDGMLLVSTCGGSDICFFDTITTNKLYQIKAHSNITNFAFSPDGSLLAASSNWGLISLWAVPPFDFNPVREQTSPSSSNNSITSWDFNQDGNLEGWGEQDWQHGDLTNPIVQDGSLRTKTTGNDPQIYSIESLDIDASKYTHIELRMRVSSGNTAQLFFINKNNDWSEDKSVFFPIQPGAEFQTYTLDMSKIASWKNIIYQLRLDPTYDVNDAIIEIDYIQLLP